MFFCANSIIHAFFSFFFSFFSSFACLVQYANLEQFERLNIYYWFDWSRISNIRANEMKMMSYVIRLLIFVSFKECLTLNWLECLTFNRWFSKSFKFPVIFYSIEQSLQSLEITIKICIKSCRVLEEYFKNDFSSQ